MVFTNHLQTGMILQVRALRGGDQLGFPCCSSHGLCDSWGGSFSSSLWFLTFPTNSMFHSKTPCWLNPISSHVCSACFCYGGKDFYANPCDDSHFTMSVQLIYLHDPQNASRNPSSEAKVTSLVIPIYSTLIPILCQRWVVKQLMPSPYLSKVTTNVEVIQWGKLSFSELPKLGEVDGDSQWSFMITSSFSKQHTILQHTAWP